METKFIHVYSLGSRKYFLRDAVHYEANDSKFSTQPAIPMTAILDGNNSWVSEGPDRDCSPHRPSFGTVWGFIVGLPTGT